MHLVFNPFSLISLASALLTSWAAALIWKRWELRIARPLFLLMALNAFWALGDALENATLGIPGKILWGKVQYLGTLTTPVLVLLFAFEYSGLQRWLTRRRIALLFAVPAITLGLVWTNEWHGLIWPSVTLSPTIPNLAVYAHGLGFWLGSAGYSNLVLLAATVLVLQTALRLPTGYHLQLIAVVLAILFPWGASLLYLFGRNPFPGLELTPLFVGVSGSLLAWAILYNGFLSLVPINRHTLIETMDDGVLVLDPNLRVVDCNPVLRQLAGHPEELQVGHPFKDLARVFPLLERLFSDADLRKSVEVDLAGPGDLQLSVRRSPILDGGGRLSGHLLLFRDIREEQRARAKIERFDQALTRQLEEIQRLQQQLAEISVRDPLTGLFSQAYMAETIEREILRASRGAYPLSFVRVVLKAIPSGEPEAHDLALQQFAAFLKKERGPTEIICRCGSDECMVILPGTETAEVPGRVEQLLAHYDRFPVLAAGRPLAIAAGVAFYPRHGADAAQVLQASQQAMQAAVRAAGSAFVVAPDPR